jgi:hypothetical protein
MDGDRGTDGLVDNASHMDGHANPPTQIEITNESQRLSSCLSTLRFPSDPSRPKSETTTFQASSFRSPPPFLAVPLALYTDRRLAASIFLGVVDVALASTLLPLIVGQVNCWTGAAPR